MTRLGPIFCFDLSRVFVQGTTTPPTLQKNFVSVFLQGASTPPYTLENNLFRIVQGISSGCHHVRLHPKKIFMSGKEMDIKPGVNMLRHIQGISSGSHHALPTPQNFFLFLEGVKEKASAKYALTCLGYSFRMAPCPPYALEKSKHFWERASTSWARTDRLPTGGTPPVGAKLQGDALPALDLRKKFLAQS